MNKEEIKQLLQNVSVFDIFEDENLARLVTLFEEIDFKLGKNVCVAGEPGEALYIIASGKARAVGEDTEGKEVTLESLSQGAHFGEQALLTNQPWQFTVRSAGNLVLLKLPKENFLQLLDEYPDLKHYFENYISDTTVRNFIKQCTVFSPFTTEQLKQFLDAFTIKTYSAGDYIVTEGKEGDSFYLIRSGEVEVIKGEPEGRIVNRLRKGDFFGELSLLTGAPRAASVVASNRVEVLRLTKEDFEDIITSFPQIKNAILGVAAGYSQTARDYLTSDSKNNHLNTNQEPKNSPQPTVDIEYDFREEPEEDSEDKFEPKHKWRFPMILQQSEMDCGATCLKMVCKYYGLNISLNRLREMANVTREGATMYSLSRAAEALGFRTRGLRTDLNFFDEAKLPVIAHWEGAHYIIVYKTAADQIIIADPAVGRRKLSKKEFEKSWSGTLLLLEPTPDIQDIESSPSTFARFIPFVLAHKKILVQVFIASIVVQVLGLAIPLFTQNIIDKVLIKQDILMLNIMLAGMIIITIFKVSTTALRQYMLVFVMRRIDLSILVNFYNHVLGLPLKYFADRKVGDIVSRLNENEKIRELLTGTTLSVVMDLLTVIVYISLMFYYNYKLTLVVLLFIPLFIIFTLIFTPLMKKNSRKTFQAGADSKSYMVETINGINTVKALAVEKPIRWKWEEKMEDFLFLKQKGAMIGVAADSVGWILNTLSTTIILWYGAILVINGQVTIGQLMAFNILLGSAIGPVQRVVGLWDQFQEARVALERVNDVIEAELEYDPANSRSIIMPPIKGHITFKNITFSYHEDERNVLQNINLEIAPGQTIALVGRSGSGKTTLANLLLCLYKVNKGEILIDGVNTKHIDPASLRRQVGVVLQENFLFSGTIRDNIALGRPDAPLKNVISAAMLAGAHEFISEFPQGYETVIGERGMNLSGGQRQRIAIARALFNKPNILIMDEATSALDTESENIIQQNLDNILKDRTTIIIAHRLSTVKNADKIVVLDRGTIVEKGDHYELMEKKGLYFYLNSQQL